MTLVARFFSNRRVLSLFFAIGTVAISPLHAQAGTLPLNSLKMLASSDGKEPELVRRIDSFLSTQCQSDFSEYTDGDISELLEMREKACAKNSSACLSVVPRWAPCLCRNGDAGRKPLDWWTPIATFAIQRGSPSYVMKVTSTCGNDLKRVNELITSGVGPDAFTVNQVQDTMKWATAALAKTPTPQLAARLSILVGIFQGANPRLVPATIEALNAAHGKVLSEYAKRPDRDVNVYITQLSENLLHRTTYIGDVASVAAAPIDYEALAKANAAPDQLLRIAVDQCQAIMTVGPPAKCHRLYSIVEKRLAPSEAKQMNKEWAVLLLHEGKTAEAKTRLDQAGTDPSNFWNSLARLRIARRNGDKNEIDTLAGQFKPTRPDHAFAVELERVDILIDDGNLKKATPRLAAIKETARASYPGQPALHLHIGKMALKLAFLEGDLKAFETTLAEIRKNRHARHLEPFFAALEARMKGAPASEIEAKDKAVTEHYGANTARVAELALLSKLKASKESRK